MIMLQGQEITELVLGLVKISYLYFLVKSKTYRKLQKRGFIAK